MAGEVVLQCGPDCIRVDEDDLEVIKLLCDDVRVGKLTIGDLIVEISKQGYDRYTTLQLSLFASRILSGRTFA